MRTSRLKKWHYLLKYAISLIPLTVATAVFILLPAPARSADSESGSSPSTRYQLEVLQLVQGKPMGRHYPGALPTLLEQINERTSITVANQPRLISSFEDDVIFKHPFIYVNNGDREDWALSEAEIENLRAYLERGGFIFIDAGISAEFLRDNKGASQHHSFGAWEASPEIKEAFKKVFPQESFESLPRSHDLFSAFYSGLPDPSQLPDSVREFVVNEKWPDGTYSAVGLKVDGRLAVLCTPIVAMGWGKNQFGDWKTHIQFRIREGAKDLSDELRTAAYTGRQYEVTRADGRNDVIYCQERAMPAWVKEPDGTWRVFQYYKSSEISEFAHRFYTRLGINIFTYSLIR